MVLKMSRPTKDKRTGMYVLRKRVPDDLVSVLGKKELKRSLGTKDPKEARYRVAKAADELDLIIRTAVDQAQGGLQLNAQDLYQLASRWLKKEHQRVLNEQDFGYWLCTIPDTYEGNDSEEIYTLRAFTELSGIESHVDSLLDDVLARELSALALPRIERGSKLYRLAQDIFRQHAYQLSDWCSKCYHNKGLYVAPPVTMPIGEFSFQSGLKVEQKRPIENKHTLTELWLRYKTFQMSAGRLDAPNATLNEYEGIVKRFIELYGDVEVSRIDRELVYDYQQKLSLTPSQGEGVRKLTAQQQIKVAKDKGLPLLSPSTVRKRLQAISAVLSHATELGWIDENPIAKSNVVKRVRQAVSRSAQQDLRREYSGDELRQIFSSPVFTAQGQDSLSADHRDYKQALFWIPLIAYYTGARRNEIAQLDVADVRFDAEVGCYYFNILKDQVDEDEQVGKRVKNESSKRRVPVHPDLVEIGLIRYAQSLQSKGQLFPMLEMDRFGKYGTKFGKLWAAYLKEYVPTVASKSKQPLHAFRHTFKTIARSSGIPRDISERLTGHSAQSVGDSYGSWTMESLYVGVTKLKSLSSFVDQLPKYSE